MQQSYVVTDVNSSTSPVGGSNQIEFPALQFLQTESQLGSGCCSGFLMVCHVFYHVAGKTKGVWVVDSTPPSMIFISAEADLYNSNLTAQWTVFVPRCEACESRGGVIT